MSETIALSADPSMSDLRAMINATAQPAEAKPATSEPAEATTAATETETESEPVEQKTATEESEEALPPGVEKRIAKEAERAARAQAKIDRAISERKAKEAEAAKLEADTAGSQPVKPAEVSSDKPKKPVFGEAGHENETWEQFNGREAAHEEKLVDWVKSQALSEFKTNQAVEAAQKANQEKWDAAVAKHGAEFPALMDAAVKSTPEGLQKAISALDNWSDVAVHLAKDPAKLKALSAEFTANPYKAIATLGRIEAALTSKETVKAETKALPEPLAKVGGNASVSGRDLQQIATDGSVSQLRAAVAKLR